MRLSICLLLCFVSCVAAGKNWAMLFTGASGWKNYCTNANLCHAYQVLHKAGIPDERIVVIMYDDIANNPRNPFPGKLFNSYNHTDVYQGTPIDYSGKEVTTDLVLAALKGDRETVKKLTGREGKVLDAGPDDNVFVAVSTHGGSGVLLMPDGFLTAVELNQALEYMHANKKYGKLVFYLESCLSGSMFKDLSKDMNIYAITAANETELAWMNYCEDPEIPNICLGGEYSTTWIENTEAIALSSGFSFGDQSKVIIEGVKRSHPQMYGDLDFLDIPLKKFFSAESRSGRVPMNSANTHSGDHGIKVPFSNMELHLLQREVQANPTDVNLRIKLAQHEAMRAQVDRFFYLTAKNVYPATTQNVIDGITETKAETINNWDCYGPALNAVSTSCKGLLHNSDVQGYFLSKLSALVNLCNRETGPVVTQAVFSAAEMVTSCN